MNWYKTSQVRPHNKPFIEDNKPQQVHLGIRLWLDDVRPMPSQFNTHVQTAKEAIDIIKDLMSKDATLEAVSLDHDLGLPEEVNGNGYQVASFIEEQAFHGNLKRIPHMSIHSDNAVGVQKMKSALLNAKRFWDKHEQEI